MIPPEYFTSESLLFEEMSSDAEDEDWSTIRSHNRAWKAATRAKRARGSDQVPSSSGVKQNREEEASNKPASKKLKSSHSGFSSRRSPPESTEATADQIPILPPHDLPLTTGVESVSADAAQSVGLEVAELSPRLALKPPGASSVIASTRQLKYVENQLPSSSSEVSLSSVRNMAVLRPVERAATTSSARVISKDALLGRSRTAGQPARGLSGKRRIVGRNASGDKATGPPKKQMQYFDAAIDIMSRLSDIVSKVQVLRDLTFFMVTQEAADKPVTSQTKQRLELVAKHGGTVQPSFDPRSATHIICDLPKSRKETIQHCLDGLAPDDVPHNIRIVGWRWVVDSINDGGLADQLKAELYMARVKRALTSDIKPTTRRRSSRGESPIEDFDESQETQEHRRRETPERDLLTPQCSPQALRGHPQNDPLEDFYENAMFGHDDEEDETNGQVPAREEMPAKKGYLCNDVSGTRGGGLNDDIIAKLQELLRVHEASRNPDDQWRVYAYRKAIGSLRRSYKRISTTADALRLPGIGQKTADKIAEIASTGGLQRLQFEQTGEYGVTQMLCGIYGVGPKTAYVWYSRGIGTLDDVRQRLHGITLTEAQQIGLDLYDDLQNRMPRAEAAAIFAKIKLSAINLDPELMIEVMGSYRRGRPDCGDIDILISRNTDDGRTHKGVLSRLLQALIQEGIVTHALAEPDFSGDGLEAKFMGICRLDKDSQHRRLDILTIPRDQWGASLIYFTGDDIFNRSMRLLAHHRGFSLNQRGLWRDVMRDPKTREKITEGTIVASRTEEEIFAALGVPWQLPHERVRSR